MTAECCCADAAAATDDSHCHVQLCTPHGAALPPALHCVYGTEPADWPAVAALASAAPQDGGDAECGSPRACVVPGYGVHPWHAPAVEQAGAAPWRAALWERLCTPCSSRSSGAPRWPLVGEIGLDSAAVDRATGAALDGAAQDAVFRAQWAWAVRLGRGVSVHCVRAHGALFELCRAGEAAERARAKRLRAARHRPQHGTSTTTTTSSSRNSAEDAAPAMPPVVALHSYSGSADIAAQLLRLAPARYYFGFSAAVNGRCWPAALRVLAVLPRDRVLAESDLDAAPAAQAACADVVHRIAATAWHCDAAAARAVLRDNLRRFLALHNAAAVGPEALGAAQVPPPPPPSSS